MRVVFIANGSGGLYGFRQELLCELEKHGSVTLLAPDSGYVDELMVLGCTVIDTPMDRRGVNPVTDLKLFRRYRKLLRQIRPDLVITYTIKPNIYGGIACRMAGIPYAANITGLGTAFQKNGLLRTLVTVMYRTALRKAKVVFFENCENIQTLLEKKIVREEQCCLLSGAGVNLERYALAEYPAQSDETCFLFVGRVMREKGVDELFAAMERLHEEGVPCSLDVLGDYEEDYKEQIQRFEAAGWLHYHGYQQDVRPFIRNCHCFVLPSWHEGMANTNLECAAMGRPLITSRIHGCMEAVIEGESGLLCQAQNADSLYATMKKFVQLPLSKRSAMGLAGRKHMETVFDKKKVVAETVARLQESLPN